MKKKIALVALIFAMLVTPAFAIGGVSDDNSFGIGLNLGNNTGVGMRFGFGDFDVLANVGLAAFSLNSSGLGLGGDAAFSWNFYTIDGGRALEFPLTVGAGVSSSFFFGENTTVNLSVLFPVGVEYNFDQLDPDVPITVYFRLAPGFTVLKANNPDVSFEMSAYLGALWNF